jgi:hypothetical protein
MFHRASVCTTASGSSCSSCPEVMGFAGIWWL